MIAVTGDSTNIPSVRFHERQGFRPTGTLKAVGHKHGAGFASSCYSVISPLMPPPAAAIQAMTSRSRVSMANATWTVLPFQHGMMRPSEAQRRFGAGSTTLPLCTRMLRLAVQGGSVSAAQRMRRSTRCRFTSGSPAAHLDRFSRAVTRR